LAALYDRAAEDEALEQRIPDLEAKLVAAGWRNLMHHVAEHGRRIFDPSIIDPSERAKTAEVVSGVPLRVWDAGARRVGLVRISMGALESWGFSDAREPH
jgi:hypothetical protein